MDIEQSTIIERIDMQELEIVNNPITRILSYSLSLSRKKIIITTENGLCIVNNSNRKFKRFENEENPFYPEKTQGISIGSILEERPEVAIVPRKNTKNYSNTTVYIFGIFYHYHRLQSENNTILQ